MLILQYYLLMQVQSLLDRIGMGPTHYWMLLALSITQIINGYKIVMVSLISPYLKEQWSLDEEVKNIPLAFYFGIIAGSFLAGSLANFSGRKPTLILGQVLQVISSYLLVSSTHFSTFLLNLIVAGMSFGVTLIMVNTLLSEQMPQQYRGKSLLFTSFITIMGKFFAIFAAYFFGLKNWRTPELVLIGIGLLLILLYFMKIPESFRVLLLKGEVNESQKLLSSLLNEQKKTLISNEEKKMLKKWSQKNLNKNRRKNTIQQIFSKNALKTTLTLSLNWLVINFMFYGQLFIMPFIFQKKQKQSGAFAQFTQMILGELPSIILTFNMIERNTFGRKNSLAIFFFAAALLNFSLVYVESVVIISLSRLAMKSVLQILHPFTTQSYSTSLRSSGLAFCIGVGRLGNIVMPMIVYPLYLIQPYLVFVTFMVASIIGLYSAMSSHETLHKSLDDVQQDDTPFLGQLIAHKIEDGKYYNIYNFSQKQ